jgi:hypothetical protein
MIRSLHHNPTLILISSTPLTPPSSFLPNTPQTLLSTNAFPCSVFLKRRSRETALSTYTSTCTSTPHCLYRYDCYVSSRRFISMFCIGKLFRMSRCIRRVGGVRSAGSSGHAGDVFLHFHIVIFEFDVLGAVEDSLCVVVRIG